MIAVESVTVFNQTDDAIPIANPDRIEIVLSNGKVFNIELYERIKGEIIIRSHIHNIVIKPTAGNSIAVSIEE